MTNFYKVVSTGVSHMMFLSQQKFQWPFNTICTICRSIHNLLITYNSQNSTIHCAYRQLIETQSRLLQKSRNDLINKLQKHKNLIMQSNLKLAFLVYPKTRFIHSTPYLCQVVQSKRFLWIYHRSNTLVGECVVPIASSNDHRQPFPHAPNFPGTEKAFHEQIVFYTSQCLANVMSHRALYRQIEEMAYMIIFSQMQVRDAMFQRRHSFFRTHRENVLLSLQEPITQAIHSTYTLLLDHHIRLI